MEENIRFKKASALPAATGALEDETILAVGADGAMNRVSVETAPTENSNKIVKSGGIFAAIAAAIVTAVNAAKEWVSEGYAKVDGWYHTLVAGAAENLVGQTVDSEAYLIRPTGGAGNEVANGVASVLGMEGNSAVWNQLCYIGQYNVSGITQSPTDNGGILDGTASATVYIPLYRSGNVYYSVAGHKYYVDKGSNNTGYRLYNDNGGISTGYAERKTIATASGTDKAFFFQIDSGTVFDNLQITPKIIDLTLLGIDNLTTVAQVEAWLAQHPGTKPFYAFNAGTILSAQTFGIKTYGRNLLNPTTRQARLIPYTWEENSNVYTIKNVPSGATATFTPDATGVAETVDISGGSLDITSYGSGVLELSAATADTYICMKWDGAKDDDVVPFEEHTYDFDVRKVYGKVNGAGEYVQCFPNGMRRAGTAKDSLTAAGATKVIGNVDLGTLNWAYYAVSGGRSIFTSTSLAGKYKASGSNDIACNALCAKYTNEFINKVFENGDFGLDGYQSERLIICENSYTDAATFKTAMNGVMFDYELATPITYTDLVYRDGGIDRPLSEVLISMEVNNWSMEEQLLTPYVDGNPTSVPATIKTQYGMDAVEAIDTLQKTTYTEGDVHDNLAAMLSCINTNCSTVLGGTFAVSDTATDKVFEFTFTPTPEPEP